jgi:hypothetical protein
MASLTNLKQNELNNWRLKYVNALLTHWHNLESSDCPCSSILISASQMRTILAKRVWPQAKSPLGFSLRMWEQLLLSSFDSALVDIPFIVSGIGSILLLFPLTYTLDLFAAALHVHWTWVWKSQSCLWCIYCWIALMQTWNQRLVALQGG